MKGIELNEATPDMRILVRLQELIELHFRTWKNGDFYADLMQVNVFKLNRLAFDYLGKTIQELIWYRVLEEVQQSMADPGVCSLPELAKALGFSNADFLISYVRKFSGLVFANTLLK